MVINCFNCDELIDIEEIVYEDENIVCPNCFANQNIEIYKKCPNCKMMIIQTSVTCPNCEFNFFKNVYKKERFRFNYKLISANDDYKEAVNYLNNLNYICIDTETNSLDPFTGDLLLIQLGNDKKIYIFPPLYHKKLSEEKFWFDRKHLYILHNAKFDYKFLKLKLNIELDNIFDTMIAERLLTCGLGRFNSLKFITKKYLNIQLDKEVRQGFTNMNKDNFNEKINNALLHYSADDVGVLQQIFKIQSNLLNNKRLNKIANIEFDFIKVLAEIELLGINFDFHLWGKLIKKVKIQNNLVKDQIIRIIEDKYPKNMFGDISINLNSSQEILKLFKLFNIKSDTTSIKEISKINSKITQLLTEFKKNQKLISSFGDNFEKFINPITKRIHPDFNQIGADTGRLSCTNPNLQQIPALPEYRQCFIAPKGKKLVTGDYSQQELRILASLSKDKKFIQMYKQGVDLHSATASMMFKIPIEKVEKEKHRKIAKTINFGLAYGRGPASLALELDISVDEAKELIKKYFHQFPSIQRWLEKEAKSAVINKYSQTILGRKRFYNLSNDQKHSDEILSAIMRKGKNTPIQGSASDMIKIALIRTFEQLKKSNIEARLVNTVHDEIVIESNEKDAEKSAKIMRDSMVYAGESLINCVPIIAEVNIGDYWWH